MKEEVRLTTAYLCIMYGGRPEDDMGLARGPPKSEELMYIDQDGQNLIVVQGGRRW